jgi:hypothetical protein
MAIQRKTRDWPGVIGAHELEDGQLAQVVSWSLQDGHNDKMATGDFVQRVGADLFTLGKGSWAAIPGYFTTPASKRPSCHSAVFVAPDGATLEVYANTAEHLRADKGHAATA